MSARAWAHWGFWAGWSFLMLWVTKPFTTGFERWVPTPAAHLVMACVVAVLWVAFWVGDQSRRRQ